METVAKTIARRHRLKKWATPHSLGEAARPAKTTPARKREKKRFARTALRRDTKEWPVHKKDPSERAQTK